MPIRLTAEDMDFVRRVEGYCTLNLGEPEMAKRESVPLSTFRGRLVRCGLVVEKRTRRRVVRAGSFEPLSDLLARGEIVAIEPALAESVA